MQLAARGSRKGRKSAHLIEFEGIGPVVEELEWELAGWGAAACADHGYL